jgi:hypothetical protein
LWISSLRFSTAGFSGLAEFGSLALAAQFLRPRVLLAILPFECIFYVFGSLRTRGLIQPFLKPLGSEL